MEYRIAFSIGGLSLKNVNFGIIGCGAIAEKHGQALLQLDNANLVAASDVDISKAERFAEKYFTKTASKKVYDDYKEMLRDSSIDAVIVATPSGMHTQMALDALDAGKHVLVEKPLTLNRRDAEALVSKAEIVNRCLGTVHPNRYYETSQILKSYVSQGRFGKLSHGVVTLRWNRSQAYYDEASWRKTRNMDGGILFNQAWHALDLLLWFMGSPVRRTHGISATRFHDIETEDVVLGTMEFEDGSLGLIEATTNVYPKNLEQTVSIFGEKGTAVLGGSRIDSFRTWRVEGDDEGAFLAKWGENAPRHEPSWAHKQVISEFLSNISHDVVVSDVVLSAVKVISCINEMLDLE